MYRHSAEFIRRCENCSNESRTTDRRIFATEAGIAFLIYYHNRKSRRDIGVRRTAMPTMQSREFQQRDSRADFTKRILSAAMLLRDCDTPPPSPCELRYLTELWSRIMQRWRLRSTQRSSYVQLDARVDPLDSPESGKNYPFLFPRSDNYLTRRTREKLRPGDSCFNFSPCSTNSLRQRMQRYLCNWEIGSVH